MVNYYDKHLFISKKKLAELADVSPRTFSRYLASRRHILEAMGISPKAQKLPPQAVKYICEDYCIDLPPELQNQQVLEKSPIYPPTLTVNGPESQKFHMISNFLSLLSAKDGQRLCQML